MSKLTSALALFLGLLLAQAVCAQEVLVDQWTEDFMGGRKASYAHVKIVTTPEGFREERQEYWPSAGGLCGEKSRTETDREGRVRRVAGTSTTPLGATRYSGQREAKGFAWRMRYSEQEPLSGMVKEEVYDSGIVALLIARGQRKAALTELRTLNLPHGARERSFSVRLDKDTLELGDDQALRLYDRSGRLLQELRYDLHHETLIATEAQAKDMSRVLVSQPQQLEVEGLRVTAPEGGWALATAPAGYQPQALLLHPYRILLSAEPIPLTLPADRKGLREALPRMSEALNRNAQDSGTTYRLGQATEAWGLPALHFEVESDLRGEEATGEAWLVRLSGSRGVMVLLLGPNTQRLATKPLFREACRALRLSALAHSQPTTFPGGLKVELPETWRKGETKGRAAWTSPEGAYLSAWVQETPGKSPRSFLDDWADHTATRLSATPGKVEQVMIGGRRLFKVEIDAEKAGTQMKVRLITGQAAGGETFLMVAIDTAGSPRGALDTLLGKATWTSK